MKLKEILQNYKAPVDEAEWTSIAQDPSVMKFNRKQRRWRVSKYVAGAVALSALVAVVGVFLHDGKNQTQIATPNVTTSLTKTETETQKNSNVARTSESTIEQTNTPTNESAPLTMVELPTPTTSTKTMPENADRKTTPVETVTSQMSAPTNTVVLPTPTKSSATKNTTAVTVKKVDPTVHVKEVEPEENENETYVWETETEEEKFFVPNSFTPNGDGLNDLFMAVANYEPKTYELAVYSRTGDLVFKTRNIRIGWDGDRNPAGLYNYVIRYTNMKGKTVTKKGQVMMLK